MAKVEFTNKEFAELKFKVEEEYKRLGKVQCPYLECEVVFNAKGIEHLKMKRWNHARPKKDQYTRLKLLHLAPEILKKSHTLQGVDEGKKFERIKINSRWEEKLMDVSYYEFIGVIKNCRLRIIVKQVGSSKPFFWSIVPYWRQGAYRKKMFEGDPESD